MIIDFLKLQEFKKQRKLAKSPLFAELKKWFGFSIKKASPGETAAKEDPFPESDFDGINEKPEERVRKDKPGKLHIEEVLNNEFNKGSVPDIAHESAVNQAPEHKR